MPHHADIHGADIHSTGRLIHKGQFAEHPSFSEYVEHSLGVLPRVDNLQAARLHHVHVTSIRTTAKEVLTRCNGDHFRLSQKPFAV
jgi:hypothetical protein